MEGDGRPTTERAGKLATEVRPQHIPASRSTYCEGRLKTPLISVRLAQRPAGLPVLTSQSAFRLSITTSLWVSSSQRSRNSIGEDDPDEELLCRHPSTKRRPWRAYPDAASGGNG